MRLGWDRGWWEGVERVVEVVVVDEEEACLLLAGSGRFFGLELGRLFPPMAASGTTRPLLPRRVLMSRLPPELHTREASLDRRFNCMCLATCPFGCDSSSARLHAQNVRRLVL